MWYVINSNELYHHGIKGQKWGVRKYQNEDGSLTEAGRKRYGYSDLDKMSKSKTDFGASWRADNAAYKRARLADKEGMRADKNKIVAYGKTALGATGAARRLNARADTYGEASKEMEKQGRMKTAIKMQAVANNNRAWAREKEDQAKTKNLLDRYAKETFQSDRVKRYSNAGREYSARSEAFKNSLTLGIYSVVADHSYSKKYSEKERLERLRNG